ncbi:hypothetical protein GPL21_39390 [Bradyrhizobium pachyrhizi]|uniref:Uncharacterized protein n=1 Tax=Bradyrhizobium pachyrhizi TaxID=280333 RepID=A0A844T906_9BRAD|nr:hypothetical protein [Bradyrhizobium pachyrhizi]
MRGCLRESGSCESPESPPHPEFAPRENSGLSPHAGRGEEEATPPHAAR